MLIQSLELENYRLFEQAALDLPEAVIGIIGPNGAGKTSLIEAVAWALYGTVAARTGKDDVKSAFADPAATCRVVLRFTLHDQSYRLERRLLGKTNRAEVELHDGAGTLRAVGVSDVQESVTRLLGLDFKGFLTSYLARQQELNALSDLVPSKRREHLAGMLGVDRLDRALVDLRAELKEGQSEVDLLSGQLASREQLQQQLKELAKHHRQLQKAASEAAGARDKQRDQLVTLTEQVKTEQQRQVKCSELTHTLRGARSTEKDLKDRQLRLEHERATLAEAVREVQALEAKLAPFPELRQRRDRLTQQRADQRLRSELLRQRDQLTEQLTGIESDRRAGLDALKAIKAEQQTLPADLDRQRREIEQELTAAREAFVEHKAAVTTAAAEVSRLQERLADMSAVGAEATCDRCGRAFGDDLETIRTHFESELKAATTTRAEQEKMLTAIRDRGESAAARQKELDQITVRAAELDRQHEQLTQTLADLDRQREQVKGQRAGVVTRLEAITAEPVDETELKQLETQLEELSAARDRRATLQGRLDRREPVEQEIRDTKAALGNTGETIAKLEQDLQALGFDQAAYDQHTAALRRAEQAYETASTAAAESARDLALVEREQQLKQEQLDSFAEIEQRLAERKDAVWHDQKVKSLLTAFRTQVIATIRPTLSATASRLMADMTDGRYAMIELDEEYNLQMMDGGRLYPIERFSGGEKDLANLCLRLAISQALTHAAGIDRAGVMLDEIFGSQDDTRRELIFDGLAGLTRTFSQGLLVTHIEDIKNRVGALVEVRPNGEGRSEVVLHV